jgi:hypothetical protein
MTNQQHPITPPPELVKQWLTEGHHQDYCSVTEHAIAQAARWGADQELEACVKWIEDCGYHPSVPEDFRNARRPEPPNKKQRGLTALEATNLKKDDPLLYQEILNAIKALPND